MSLEKTRQEGHGEEGQRYILIYDGSCPLCKSIVGALSHIGLLEKVWAVRFEDMPPGECPAYDEVRSQVVLIDAISGRRLLGVSAFCELARIHGRYPHLTSLFCKPPVETLAGWIYKVIALNRRIISPPVEKAACACDPPFHLGYRLALWTLGLLIISLSVLAYGSSLYLAFGKGSPISYSLRFALGAGSGIVAVVFLFYLFLWGSFKDLVHQVLIVVVSGSLALLILAFLNTVCSLFELERAWVSFVNWFFLGAIAFHMFFAMGERSRRLGFPRWVPWLFLILLIWMSLPFIYYLNLFG